MVNEGLPIFDFMFLTKSIFISLVVIPYIAIYVWLKKTALINKGLHDEVANKAAEVLDYDELLVNTQKLYDNAYTDWKPVLDKEGVTIETTMTQLEISAGEGVRAYRTTSWLDEKNITVDRMVELLDGGWLTEEVWFKDDFKGGQKLMELENKDGRSAWVAQYLSDMKFFMFNMREFLYLLFRRDFTQEEYSKLRHPDGKTIKRQVGIVYRSVPWPVTDKDYVRAIQYPSLDRITLYNDGAIRWEHIMAFHIAGNFPLSMVNNMEKAAAKVMMNEALNMRKH